MGECGVTSEGQQRRRHGILADGDTMEILKSMLLPLLVGLFELKGLQVLRPEVAKITLRPEGKKTDRHHLYSDFLA